MSQSKLAQLRRILQSKNLAFVLSYPAFVLIQNTIKSPFSHVWWFSVISNTTLGDWSWLKDAWFNVRWLETPNIMFGVWKCQTWWLKDVTLVTIFTFGHKYHRKQVGSCLRTSLDKFEQVWRSLDKFGQVWTSLDKYGQVWTSLDKFGQVWTRFGPG